MKIGQEVVEQRHMKVGQLVVEQRHMKIGQEVVEQSHIKIGQLVAVQRQTKVSTTLTCLSFCVEWTSSRSLCHSVTSFKQALKIHLF